MAGMAAVTAIEAARRRLARLALLGLVLWPLAALADGLGYDAPQEACGLCHGMDGLSAVARFPRLAGQKAAYIEKQLQDFRTGRRGNDGGQMEAIVTEITEEEVHEVARYFAGLTPPPPIPAGNADESAALAGRLVHQGDSARGIPACASCHLPGAATARTRPPESAPHLAAQHPAYIAKQLRDFREGKRANDPTAGMSAIAKALSEAEIDALAGFFAAMPRSAHADQTP
jgi:cytochrome c553